MEAPADCRLLQKNQEAVAAALVVRAEGAAHQGVAVVEAHGAEDVVALVVASVAVLVAEEAAVLVAEEAAALVDEGAVSVDVVRRGVRHAVAVALAADEADGAASAVHSLSLAVCTFTPSSSCSMPITLYPPLSWKISRGVP